MWRSQRISRTRVIEDAIFNLDDGRTWDSCCFERTIDFAVK